MEKLSSGFRINRAGDDAAGLAISEKMRGQIRGLKQASRNAQDGISLIQTAEGALNETHAILQRMRELAVQSSTDTNTEVDRGEIQKEIDQLAAEIDRIADTTQFNTKELLNGDFKAVFHIGANEGQKVDLDINPMSAEALAVAGSGKVGEDAVVLTKPVVGGTVHGVAGQTVLQDSENSVIAVQVDGKWYDPKDVSAKTGESNQELVVDKDAKALTVVTGKTVTGIEGLLTEGRGEVLGVADQKVLFNAEGVTSHIEIAFFLTVFGVDCGAPKGAVLTLIGALENLSRNSLARVV